MTESTNNMKRIFNKFDDAGRVPATGFYVDELKSNKKVAALYEIIDLAKRNIQDKAKGLFEDFDFEIEVTLSAYEKNSDNKDKELKNQLYAMAHKDKGVSVIFNSSKLAAFSPEEAYSAVYAVLFNALLKRKDRVKDKDFEFGKNIEAKDEFDLDSKNNENQIKSQSIIARYLKKFLCKLLGLTEEDYARCSDQISKDFFNKGITDQTMFQNPNGANLLAERYGMVSKKGYQQQAAALLGVISQDQFDSLKTGNSNKIESFCRDYVTTFASINGVPLDTLNITFEPKGSLGEYTDYGATQTININLEEIKKLNNPAEVVMTLSHELTHAVDSSTNKGLGNTTKEGYGLVDNVGSNLRDNKVDAALINETREVQNYLQNLQEICYKVNPNERSARIGELSALKFMEGMQLDENMKKYVNQSIESFKNYQNDAIDAVKKVDSLSKINKLRADYSQLPPMGAGTRKLIEERLDYLEQLYNKQKLNIEKDLNAIEDAMGIKNGINNQQTQDAPQME